MTILGTPAAPALQRPRLNRRGRRPEDVEPYAAEGHANGQGAMKSAIKVSAVRLLVMRAMYLLMAAGLAGTVWPSIVSHDPSMPIMTGVALALLGTIGLLALIGLRYPLRMIPLLLFELTWKAIWLVAFALPRWLDGTLDGAVRQTAFETSLGLVLILVIPWRYVFANYMRAPAETWKSPPSAVPAGP